MELRSVRLPSSLPPSRAHSRAPSRAPSNGVPCRSQISRCLVPVVVLIVFAGLPSCGRSLPPLPAPGDRIRLEIKGKAIVAEVACDDLSRETGLMFRDRLPESTGMLFVYGRSRKLSFWMRNTTIPLSIAFLDDAGKILQIEDMHPHDETRTVSMHLVRYALEVPQGWFERNGIGVGDTFTDFRDRVGPYRG